MTVDAPVDHSYLPDDWCKLIKTEGAPKAILSKIKELRKTKKLYPPQKSVFSAFHHCSVEDCKVVIMGQDPYHRPGQAMGLSFSVCRGIKVPPSLKNMCKEIDQIDGTISHGDLTKWAKQGVLLLNSILTVEEGKPMAHKKIGWTEFTDDIIQALSLKKDRLVYMLWGLPARAKKTLIEESKHYILEAGHPSPLSIRHFKGCDHFNKCNDDLKQRGLSAIDWNFLRPNVKC